MITDHYTKYAVAVPTPNQKARTVAKCLWENFTIHYGIPEHLHSDQGPDFKSKTIKELCEVAGIQSQNNTIPSQGGVGSRPPQQTAADQSWREKWLKSSSWKETSVARPYLYWSIAQTMDRSLWKWEPTSSTDGSTILSNAAQCLQRSRGSLTQKAW